MRRVGRAQLVVALLVAGLGKGGCESEEGSCGPLISPHISPIYFGDVKTLANGEEPDVATLDTAPFEFVLILESACDPAAGGPDLVIDGLCLVGDAHNGDATDPAFSIEGPVPSVLGPGELAAVRITYDPSSVAEDTDDDGVPDYDSVALVVQSNATDTPTLVVPMCARLVGQNAELDAAACTSPVPLIEGEADLTLCE